MFVLFLRPINFTTENKRMKKSLKKWVLLLIAAITLPASAMAQDKVEWDFTMDVVSSYIWRGQKLGNAGLHTNASVAYKGFSFSAWSPIAFDGKDDDEIDLTLAYETGNFSISLTDYWLTDGDDEHTLEAQVGYDFGVVAANWYTNLHDAEKEYASYFTLTAPFSLLTLDWEAEVGVTPWGTEYYGTSGFTVCDLSLGASKEIKITKNFSTTLFAKASFNPSTENLYGTVGISF
jgi:hypothetical protein